MKLIADNACCNNSLKISAIAVAIFWILLTALIPVLLPHEKLEWYIGLPIIIVNAALLIGALKNISWLLLPWLLHALAAFIIFMFALYAIIYLGRGPRGDILPLAFVIYTSIFAFCLYCTFIVYSLFWHLRDSSSFPIPTADV